MLCKFSDYVRPISQKERAAAYEAMREAGATERLAFHLSNLYPHTPKYSLLRRIYRLRDVALDNTIVSSVDEVKRMSAAARRVWSERVEATNAYIYFLQKDMVRA